MDEVRRYLRPDSQHSHEGRKRHTECKTVLEARDERRSSNNGASVKYVAGAKLIAATRQPQCFSDQGCRFNDIYKELFTLHIPCPYFPVGTAQRAERSAAIWRLSSATASLAAATMAS